MKLIWAPGYAILYISYLFPTEWGKKRSVAQSGRQWKHRDVLAPIYSIIFYFVLLFAIFALVKSHFSGLSGNLVSTNVSSLNSIPVSDQSSLQKSSPVNTHISASNESQINIANDPKQNDNAFEDSFSKFIENLEREKNYFGNDQIVRCRLRIPQKKLETSSQIEIWKSINTFPNKEDAIELILKEQCK